MFDTDTIAAISTPHGTGGIGIIRISGNRAFEIAQRMFKTKMLIRDIASHTVVYGRIFDPDEVAAVDEVLLLKLDKPKTFTREDMIEIDCHGGIVVLRRVLEIILKSGARLAEPGEFTKRAFLNGRIDLSQAEAVIDLINAKTEEGSKAALNQLEGRLSGEIGAARKKLIELMAHMEVTFDYPEHDIEEVTSKMVSREAEKVKKKLEAISKGFSKGRIFREGINLVITGKPNVGKSSLLNVLSGSNRAIVTDIPGTTRDILEEYINIRGIPARVTDTAGIRETQDVVEKIGVEKAEKAIEAADLAIIMLDAVSGIEDADRSVINAARNNKSIYLVNKIDLVGARSLAAITEKLEGEKVLAISIKEAKGLEELEDMIYNLFMGGDIKANEEILLTNIRHKNHVDTAIKDLDRALEALNSGMPLDLAAIDIKSAAENLGLITGESVSEDVLEEIFSKFCVGK